MGRTLRTALLGVVLVGCGSPVAQVSAIPRVDPARSTVSLAPEQAKADGQDPVQITVVLVDRQGTPISGRAVELTASGRGNAWLTTAPPTDAEGSSTATLASTVAETKTITARAAGVAGSAAVELTQHATATFVPGPPGMLVFDVPPSTVLVGAQIAPPVRVVVQDAQGNPVTDPIVEVTLSLEPNPRGATLSGTLVRSSEDGVASFPDLVVEKAGSDFMLVASADGAPSTVSPPFNVIAKPGQSLVFLSQPANVIAGATMPPVEVAVQDVDGRIVEDPPAPVTLALVPLTGTATLEGFTSVTTVNGIARFSGLHVDVSGFGNRLAATAPALVGASSEQFDVRAGPPVLSTSSFTSSDPVVVADGTHFARLTVTLRDLLGNPTPEKGVTITSSSPGDLFHPDPASGGTDENGQFIATISSISTGPRVLTAEFGPFALTTTVTFAAGPPASANTTFTATPSSLIADGSSAATLTLTVQDALGHVVPGQAVSLTISGNGNQTSPEPASGTTDANGQFVVLLTSTVAESKTITATAGSATAETTVTFVPGAPSASSSTLTATPGSVVADGVTAATLSATVMDALGNVIPNATVTFGVGGSANALSSPTATTDAAGVAAVTLTSTKAETKALTASVGGAMLSGSVTFVAGPVSALRSTLNASPSTATASGLPNVTLTAVLKDEYGNPVPDVPVIPEIDPPTGFFLEPHPTWATDAAGTFVDGFGSFTAETRTITFTVDGITLSTTVTFVPDVPSAAQSTFTVAPATLPADGTSAAVLTATVKDALGNAVPHATVLFFASGTGNILSDAAASTDASGVASVTLASTNAETKSLTASVGGFTMTGSVTFTSCGLACGQCRESTWSSVENGG